MTSLLSISLVLVLLLGANGWCTKHYFTVPANPNIMEISPDNSYMAITSTGSNKVYVYDLYNYNRLLEYTPSSGTVVTAKFSIDGNYLAIALDNRSIVFLSGGPTFNQTVKTTLTTTNLISDIDFSPNGNNKLLVCFTTNLYHIYSNYLNSTSNTFTFTSNATTQIRKCKFSKNDSVVFIDNANTVKVIGSGNTMTTNCIATTHSILDVKLTTGAIKFIVGGANQNSFYGTDPTGTLITNNYSPLSTPGSGNAGVACYAGDGQFYTFANTGTDRKVYIFADNNTLYDVFSNVNANLLSCKYTHNG